MGCDEHAWTFSITQKHMAEILRRAQTFAWSHKNLSALQHTEKIYANYDGKKIIPYLSEYDMHLFFQ